MAEEYRANPQAYAKQAEKTTAEAAGESMEAKEQVSVTCTSPHHDEVTKPKAMMGLWLQSFARLALLPANSPPNISETPVWNLLTTSTEWLWTFEIDYDQFDIF